MLNEGALEAVRKGADIISRADIYNGMDRVLQVCFLPLVLFPLPSTVSLFGKSGGRSFNGLPPLAERFCMHKLILLMHYCCCMKFRTQRRQPSICIAAVVRFI